MKLQQLVDFQVAITHDLTTADCKNLNSTRALLSFKIKTPDGQTESHKLECSLEELAQIRKELVRVEETLS